jgi:hypothetical protein
MVRVCRGGVSAHVEVWAVPPSGLASILLQEPSGLSIGKVMLRDGSEVLGVLGEPALCENQKKLRSIAAGGAISRHARRSIREQFPAEVKIGLMKVWLC